MRFAIAIVVAIVCSMVSLFTLAGAKVRVLSLSKYWPQLLAMARLYQSCERRIKAKLNVTKWAERKKKANQQQTAKIQALNKKAADKATKKAAFVRKQLQTILKTREKVEKARVQFFRVEASNHESDSD